MFLRKLLPKASDGSIKYKDTPIEESPIFLGDNVAEIRPDKQGGAVILCYGDVEVSGRPCTGSHKLSHDTLISINNLSDVFIFKDEQEKIKRKQTRIIKLKMMSEVEEEEKDLLPEIREKVLEEFTSFANSCAGIKSLKEFSIAFCRYAQSSCSFDRSILYFPVKDPNKKTRVIFYPLVAFAPEKKYKPSGTILKKMYSTGEPVYMITREKKEEELSLSIVQHEIKSVLAFPIFNRFNRVIALFYADASEHEVSKTSFITISYFCEHLSPYLVSFLAGQVPELKEIKL